jgi:hypothetical protein
MIIGLRRGGRMVTPLFLGGCRCRTLLADVQEGTTARQNHQQYSSHNDDQHLFAFWRGLGSGFGLFRFGGHDLSLGKLI